MVLHCGFTKCISVSFLLFLYAQLTASKGQHVSEIILYTRALEVPSSDLGHITGDMGKILNFIFKILGIMGGYSDTLIQ